ANDYSILLGKVIEEFCREYSNVELDIYCNRPYVVSTYKHAHLNITVQFVEANASYQDINLVTEFSNRNETLNQHCFFYNELTTVNKIIFLDIDGVLQPISGRGKRFEQDLKKLKENCSLENRLLSQMDEYDIGAVYLDWDNKAVEYLIRLCQEENAK